MRWASVCWWSAVIAVLPLTFFFEVILLERILAGYSVGALWIAGHLAPLLPAVLVGMILWWRGVLPERRQVLGGVLAMGAMVLLKPLLMGLMLVAMMAITGESLVN